MLIAHLPAGYLMTSLCRPLVKLHPAARHYRLLSLIGLTASVAPDFDMIWYYFVDNRQTFHHDYFTHTPLFWAAVTLCLSMIATLANSRALLIAAFLILANSLTHLGLDSVVSNIHWTWPTRWGDVWLIHLPRQYNWWVWNYVFYWTFLLELGILFAAIGLWWWRWRWRAVLSFDLGGK